MVGVSEGVGEERAGAVGERGNHVAKTWRVSGRPRGVANVRPEGFVGSEGVELRGDAGGGGEGGPV